MTVRFRPFTWITGAGTPTVTQFVDTFNRADTVNGLGANYIGSSRNPLQSAVLAVPSVRVVSAQMVAFSNGAGLGSQVPGTVFFVVPLLNTSVYGKSQFAELTFQASGGGGDSAIAPGVMFAGSFACNDGVGYYMDTDVGAGTQRIRLWDGIAASTLVSAAFVPAPGDVLRLEATANAGSTDLRGYANGVLLASVNSVSIVRSGYPLLWSAANVPANTRTFSRFAAGIL